MRDLSFYIILSLLLLPSLALADVKTPDDLDLDSTSSTITVTWTANTNDDDGDNDDGYDDTDGYYIYYHESGDDDTEWRVQLVGETNDSFTITGLSANTYYLVEISAYDGDSESSTDSESITTDSVDVDIEITGTDEVTISLDASESSIEEYSVTVGTTSGGTEIYGTLTTPVLIDVDDSLVVSGLSSGTYYIGVTTFPHGDVLPVEAFSFEDTHTFLGSADDDIEDGCFIETSTTNPVIFFMSVLLCLVVAVIACPGKLFKKSALLLILLLTLLTTESLAEEGGLYKNTFGIKGGLFLPNESDQADIYDTIVPFSLFYERMITDYLSADIDLGYSKSDGTAVTNSSSTTELDTELEMYPAAVSLNFNYDIAPYITAYFGVGGDWWRVEEKSELGEYKSDVGGWHAKTGLKIFSDELDTFKQLGFLMDISYTEIDRFGQNDVDLGGWKFNIGLMYCL